MPVRKVKGGFKWGNSGKIYPTKEKALEQGRAIIISQKNARKKRKPRGCKTWAA